ncbi:hypothetical protein RUM44_005792 [Polyplax serrata]|uniref:GINS complex subunit 2 n=1 Tax=Polyplax serrata TaxID=468196 RepID=A0ABR1AY33_POLSC
MEPDEIEFLAEESLITIIPKFSCRKTYLITGEVGPFRAGLPTKVPLWLASDLRRRQKCRIVPPDWMDIEKLNQLNNEEAGSVKFCKIPSENYFVEAKIILGFGIEDNPNFSSIMTAVKDLWDRRKSKLEDSVDVFMNVGRDYVRIPNITAAELSIIRPVLPHAIDFLNRLSAKEHENPERPEASDYNHDCMTHYSEATPTLNYRNFSTAT